MAEGPHFVPGDERPLGGSFQQLVKKSFRYRRFDGEMSREFEHEIVKRPDAAAILLLDQTAECVVLVTQFRVAAASPGIEDSGWMIELPAGVVEKGESARDCAIREAREETGYQPDDCELIASFYPSVGGSTEVIHVFFARVTSRHRVGHGGGKGDEHVVPFPIALPCLWQMVDRGEIRDAKLLIAAQWLRQKLSANDPRVGSKALAPKLGQRYVLGGKPGTPECKRRYISYETGDISLIDRRFDVWVNSENTDMLMARFFEPAISGTIRYLGATKFKNGDVREDTIAELLRHEMAGQIFVKPGEVIATKSGNLRKTHGVRLICHAAAVHAMRGYGEWGSLGVSEACIRKALLEVEARNRGLRGLFKPYRSILFPLLGTGNGKQSSVAVAEKMIAVARQHLLDDRSKLREICFIAYNHDDRQAICSAIMKHEELEPVPLTPEQEKARRKYYGAPQQPSDPPTADKRHETPA